LDLDESLEILANAGYHAHPEVKRSWKKIFVGIVIGVTALVSSAGTLLYERIQRPPALYDQYKEATYSLANKLAIIDDSYDYGDLKNAAVMTSARARYETIYCKTFEYHEAPEELSGIEGDTLLYIDKDSQVLQVWKRSDFVLLEELLCSTGKNAGDKRRAGDMRSPSGPFTLISKENSADWEFEGRKAYGPFFYRMDVGSWDSQGKHFPRGRSSIGIHGTDKPDLLGTRASHSCIRINSGSLGRLDGLGILRPGVTGYVGTEKLSEFAGE